MRLSTHIYIGAKSRGIYHGSGSSKNWGLFWILRDYLTIKRENFGLSWMMRLFDNKTRISRTFLWFLTINWRESGEKCYEFVRFVNSFDKIDFFCYEILILMIWEFLFFIFSILCLTKLWLVLLENYSWFFVDSGQFIVDVYRLITI